MANGILKADSNSDLIFNELTEITSGASITLSRGAKGYKVLALLLNTVASNPSSTRGMLLVSAQNTTAVWYPVTIDSTHGSARIGISDTTLEVLSTKGFTSLYVVNILGIF